MLAGEEGQKCDFGTILSRIWGDKIQTFLTGSLDVSGLVGDDKNRYFKLKHLCFLKPRHLWAAETTFILTIELDKRLQCLAVHILLAMSCILPQNLDYLLFRPDRLQTVIHLLCLLVSHSFMYLCFTYPQSPSANYCYNTLISHLQSLCNVSVCSPWSNKCCLNRILRVKRSLFPVKCAANLLKTSLKKPANIKCSFLSPCVHGLVLILACSTSVHSNA